MSFEMQKRVLEFSVAVLALYTSMILGIAEYKGPLPYVLTPPIAVASLIFTFRRQNLLLKPMPAFVLGLLAFSLAFAELFAGSIEARLTSGAHLLVYLTWIVLLMEKRLPQYWWIFALCVLQVAIGAVLLSTALYGAFLFGFLLLTLWTLAVFSLFRAQQRFAPDEAGTRSRPTATEPARPDAGGKRTTTAAGAIHLDAEQRWISARFVLGILAMAIGSAVVASVFFMFIPRFWLSSRAWGMESGTTEPMVGFTENVTLGSFGTLLESNKRVLEVRLFDADGEPLEVEDYAFRIGQEEPLFRGRSLYAYEDGGWSKGRNEDHTDNVSRRPPALQDAVKQEYRLSPIGSRVLFAMRPAPSSYVIAARIEGRRGPVQSEQSGKDLLSPRMDRQSVVRYSVFTRVEAPKAGNFGLGMAHLEPIDEKLRAGLEQYLEKEIGAPPVRPRLGDGRDDQRTRELVDRIVKHLSEDGGFTYSLTIPPREHRDLDPVMEFLLYRRSGHCEYYATALALLLRTAGVPARLISGFKGGTKNRLTGYHEVAQRHAHAWVEAYVDGEWITLDATPAAAAGTVEESGGFLESWRSFRNFLTHLWSSGILELDFSRQHQSLFSPLRRTAGEAWESVSRERSGTAAGLTALKEFLSNPSRWFSWQGGLISFCLLLLLASITWTVKRLVLLFRGLGTGGGRRAAHGNVEFYERFARLCAAVGLVRNPSQTQREFAQSVAATLAARSPGRPQPTAPATIASAFYDVRFGEVALSEPRRHEIDAVLAQLESAFQPANGSPNDSPASSPPR